MWPFSTLCPSLSVCVCVPHHCLQLACQSGSQDSVRVNDTRTDAIAFSFVLSFVDAPQAYPFLPYHPIRVYKVVSTYAELQFNKMMRLVPLFGHFARFQLTNSKKTDMIK